MDIFRRKAHLTVLEKWVEQQNRTRGERAEMRSVHSWAREACMK